MYSVGHFVDYIGYARGGAETNVEGLCRHNVNSPFSFEIVTSKSPFSKPNFQDLQVPVRTSIGLYHMREASFLYKGIFSDLLYRLPGTVYKLNVRRHFKRYDIIHCHSLDVMDMIRRERGKAPVALTLYNPLVNRHRRNADYADCIIVRSREVIANLKHAEPQLSSKLVHIPPGCEFSYYEPGKEDGSNKRTSLTSTDSIRLLFVGRLRPFKNLEHLLAAVQILNSEKSRRCTLTIVGSGPRQRQLVRLARNLGILTLVRFVGNLPSSQVGSVYQNHDLVVVPSYYESFSQVSLEALVARKRLLISRGLKEFHSIFPSIPTCNPDSPTNIAQKILEVIANPVVRVPSDDLSVYDWQRVTKLHYDVYTSLMDRRLPIPQKGVAQLENITHITCNAPVKLALQGKDR